MPDAKIADQVVARVNPDFNNGAETAPAVVTRALGAAVEVDGISRQSVNLHVLRDGPNTEWMAAVPLFDSEADAIEAGGSGAAAWPVGTSVDPDDEPADAADTPVKADPKTDQKAKA